MPGRRRSDLATEGARRNREQLASAGRDIRASRKRQRLTQADLAARVGLSRGSISRAERGLGGGLTLDCWQRIGLAIGRPLVVRLQADTDGETADAGHLAVQELVLRLGRAAGYGAHFELPTRPAESWRSTDVGLLDAARHRMVLVECWNSIGDVGAAARSSDRKRSEAEAVAAAQGSDEPSSVAVVWVLRATVRNRAIVARYPEIFLARFRGSSTGWVRALVEGAAPPAEPGIVWSDVAATRLFAWRQPAIKVRVSTAPTRQVQARSRRIRTPD